MWSSDSDRDEGVSNATPTSSCSPSSPFEAPPHPRRRRQRLRRRRAQRRAKNGAGEEEADAEDMWRGLQRGAGAAAWPERAARPVVEGSLDGSGGGGMGRARSLTDDDLEELKGCVDLGFGFSYDEIPELCSTLPALELCYSMSQRFLDDHNLQQPSNAEESAPAASTTTQPVATNWKISSPGDSPDEVKARLKYWAQAVACTVKLCS